MAIESKTRRVISVSPVREDTYILRMERDGMVFEPGQCMLVGLKDDVQWREYSVYSPVHEDFLEILVKEVPEGYVSLKLKKLRPGDEVFTEGPLGFFTVPSENRERPVLMVATGTGISPFHSITGSLPSLNYTLVHGVRHDDERYQKECYDPRRLHHCVTRGEAEGPTLFRGRVTEFLKDREVAPETLCYICGNSDMIYEVFDLLIKKGIPRKQIFAEVYF